MMGRSGLRLCTMIFYAQTPPYVLQCVAKQRTCSFSSSLAYFSFLSILVVAMLCARATHHSARLRYCFLEARAQFLGGQDRKSHSCAQSILVDDTGLFRPVLVSSFSRRNGLRLTFVSFRGASMRYRFCSICDELVSS